MRHLYGKNGKGTLGRPCRSLESLPVRWCLFHSSSPPQASSTQTQTPHSTRTCLVGHHVVPSRVRVRVRQLCLSNVNNKYSSGETMSTNTRRDRFAGAGLVTEHHSWLVDHCRVRKRKGGQGQSPCTSQPEPGGMGKVKGDRTSEVISKNSGLVLSFFCSKSSRGFHHLESILEPPGAWSPVTL